MKWPFFDRLCKSVNPWNSHAGLAQEANNIQRGRGVIDVTCQSSIKSLYETSAVSLFTRLPTPTLLAARGIAALKSRSQSRLHVTCFAFFPTDFRGKERLLAVYKKCRFYVACCKLFNASELPYLLLRIWKSTLGNKHFFSKPLARSNDVSDPDAVAWRDTTYVVRLKGLGNLMFLKLAYLPSKFRFSGKYFFKEHQISAGQLFNN